MSRRLAPPLAVLAMAALGACAAIPRADLDQPFVSATLLSVTPVTPVEPSPSPTEPSSAEIVGWTSGAFAEPPPAETVSPDLRDPAERVARANAAARVEPTRDGYANAVQVYAFDEGALFQVYAAPGQITDIALQPGETLSASGPVAAGDTTRWIIGDTVSGSGAETRVHILVKPTRPGLRTNLIINTDRRTYHVELHSTASIYMASVCWRYPQDERLALQMASVRSAARVTEPSLDIGALSFDYWISGDDVPWRPLRAFDDGRQVFIEFGRDFEAASLPPLFVRSGDGRSADLVNYRIAGRRIIVDRLFQTAELRLAGPRGRDQVVRIAHTEDRAR